MEDTKQNRQQFALLMGKLGVAFRVDTNKELLGVYWEFLSDRSAYQVTHAINDLIKNGDRFPVVSKIREIAGSYREFKTVEKPEPRVMIEEYTMLDHPVEDAEEFFRRILDDTTEVMTA